jgi:hypothetical protein
VRAGCSRFGCSRNEGETAVKQRAIIECTDCGHSAEIEIPAASTRRFRCSRCGGPGVVQEASLSNAGLRPASSRSAGAPLSQAKQTPSAAISGRPRSKSSSASGHGHCANCGKPIPDARLKAVPGTRLCVYCAENDLSGAPSRRVSEPWGSREAWKRDRASWKRTH